MSSAAVILFTYLWHYLVARLLYDHLVRPLVHGRISALGLICMAAIAAFAIGWWSAGARRRRA
jgi:hypothetical protein